MKVTIDETKKTIEIYESVNLNELFNYLRKLNIDLVEYTLVIKPSVTVTIQSEKPKPPDPLFPATSPWLPYPVGYPAKPQWWEQQIICKTTF